MGVVSNALKGRDPLADAYASLGVDRTCRKPDSVLHGRRDRADFWGGVMRACASRLFPLVLLATSALYAPAVFAQPCMAHHANGGLVPVRERSGPSMFWAHASWDPDGWPAITYGAAFFQLPPLMRSFTVIHECAHLVHQTNDEFFANCEALTELRRRGLSVSEESYIAGYHHRIGPLGPQYGGSGSAFWAGTLRACGE